MENPFTTPSSHAQATSHLRPPVVPNFPFSSPITEEVESPENSVDDEHTQQSKSAKNPFEPDTPIRPIRDPFADNASVSTGSKEEFGLERYIQPEAQTNTSPRRRSSVTKPSRADSRRGSAYDRSKGGNAKDRRPGLNVLTNFSRNGVSKEIRRVNEDMRRPSLPVYTQQQQQQPVQGYNFVGLDDLKSLSKAREKERFGQKSKRFLKKSKASATGYSELKDGKTGRNNSAPALARNPSLQRLKGASGKTTDLSPSDRPIVIGISVPRDSISESEGNSIAHGGLENDENNYHNAPITPSIVITPAGEDGPWNSAEESPELRSQRPASSVYSRATANIEQKPKFDASDAPPVPSIPASHFDFKSENTPVEDSAWAKRSSIISRRQRALSTGTVFEEDVSPLMPSKRPRSFSAESNLDVPTSRMSIDTIATKHRSRGWWTYLLSPLLTRSNTLASKFSPNSADRPAIPPFSARPDLLKASPTSSNEKSISSNEVSVFSPDTPTPVVDEEKKENLAEWPDMDAWDGERSRAVDNGDEPTQSAVSAQTIPFMMSPSPITQGHAVEYFYACGHDESNISPFFKCVNHMCPQNKIVGQALSDPFVGTENEGSGARGLAILPSTDSQLAKENPNNPFFRKASSTTVGDGSEIRSRSDSASTIIEDEPEYSPNVREAQAATIMRAGSPVPTPGLSYFGHSRTPSPACFPVPRGQTPNNDRSAFVTKESPPASSQDDIEQASSSQPPPYSPPKRDPSSRFPRYRAIMPPGHEPQPLSPSPISPGMQREMSGNGAINMSEIEYPQPPPATYTNRRQTTFSSVLRPAGMPVTIADIQHPVTARDNIESRRQRLEREDAMGRKAGGLWRGRGCFSERGCFGRSGREGRTRRRWYVVIATTLVIIIVVAIVLATTLTRKGDQTPIESQWLNLTGYPPMPTGISTIARPEAAVANTGCVHPSTMWSCAVPKEEQADIKPNDPEQPNFRVQISFQNGTFEHSTVLAPNDTSSQKRSYAGVGNAVSAGRFIKERLLRARDAFTDALNSPSPAPPSAEEQIFLGNTTDNIAAEPFDGEETPFFISFLSPSPIDPSTLLKRAENSSEGDSPAQSALPDVTSVIPPPSVDTDGTAAAANLYPLPSSQPVRLYDRGLPTEHYGFYTYYDRSIFLRSTDLVNSTDNGEVPTDRLGGSSKEAANYRCTWSETRFLVKIWTQPSKSGMSLLGGAATPTSTSEPTPSSTGTTLATMSATDFSPPGSFPYPVTITLDRHGGNQDRKMIYCYGMDARQNIVSEDKKLYFEFRGFGGELVNPAGKLFKGDGEDDEEEDKGPDMSWAGGVDGGTGGCSCEYRNWVKSN
ncbi:hypothetical protein FQN54_009217 [Arachnomyces sp. PD_36]|nr:hypothetical protein FQN54_009217 [Arachnomyces sp. PD_36]